MRAHPQRLEIDSERKRPHLLCKTFSVLVSDNQCSYLRNKETNFFFIVSLFVSRLGGHGSNWGWRQNGLEGFAKIKHIFFTVEWKPNAGIMVWQKGKEAVHEVFKVYYIRWASFISSFIWKKQLDQLCNSSCCTSFWVLICGQ